MRGFNSWRLQEIECIEKDLVGLWKFFRAVVLLCIFLRTEEGSRKLHCTRTVQTYISPANPLTLLTSPLPKSQVSCILHPISCPFHPSHTHALDVGYWMVPLENRLNCKLSPPTLSSTTSAVRSTKNHKSINIAIARARHQRCNSNGY